MQAMGVESTFGLQIGADWWRSLCGGGVGGTRKVVEAWFQGFLPKEWWAAFGGFAGEGTLPGCVPEHTLNWTWIGHHEVSTKLSPAVDLQWIC